MTDYFSRFAGAEGIGREKLSVVFDAERGTPDLINALAHDEPYIRGVLADLRQSLPLVPHSGIGPMGRFYRLPNHYRSVSFMMPRQSGDPEASQGVIVFKGTEPLLPDFPAYFDWMLNVPFRASPLPLGLHFPLDMKLPPSAMWIEECKAEQAVASKVQQQYLTRHGRLARLPVPLFVFKMTPEQNERYAQVVSSRLSADAMWKIKNKLADGLGVEVYYYPELPVRVSDLFVGNVRETFKAALTSEQVEATFSSWTTLLAEMLCLGYMPYAPWHHGMGGCVDPGNVCIDGGFNDLLTLVPFDAIPDELLFRRSLQASTQMLADSMTKLAAAAVGIPSVTEGDAVGMATAYITEQLRLHVEACEQEGHTVDPRLKLCFRQPQVADIVQLLRSTHRARGTAPQFVSKAEMPSSERALLRAVAGSQA